VKKRICDWIVDYFELENVEHYFGYVGHGNQPLLDSLSYKPHIKGIDTMHEATAVHMADLYYRARHKIAPVLVTVGPGFFQALSAVPNMMHEASAGVIIAGITSTSTWDKGGLEEVYYHMHEDTISVARHVFKKCWMPVCTEHALDFLSKAFAAAVTERPGPTFYAIPLDILLMEAEVKLPDPSKRKPDSRIRPGLKSLNEAVKLIYEAKRPIIHVGGGVMLSDAEPELLEFAETFKIPVTTSVIIADSAFPEDHPLFLGPVGRNGWDSAMLAMKEADLLIAVGNRFTDRETGGWINPEKEAAFFRIPPTKLIHINIDPYEIGRNYPADVGMIADAKAALRDLIDALKHKLAQRSLADPWLERCIRLKKEWEAKIIPAITSNIIPIHPARLVYDLRKAMPPDTTYVVDVSPWEWNELYAKQTIPRTCFNNTGMAQMGWATGGVLGAKLARPDKPAVCFCGDGSFLMQMHAVTTAVLHDIPVLWVILNNYGPNLERWLGDALYGRSPWCEWRNSKGELYNMDFVKFAEACGAKGERVEKPERIIPAVKHAIESNMPYVIDVVVDRDIMAPGPPGWTWEDWWPVALHPSLKGKKNVPEYFNRTENQ